MKVWYNIVEHYFCAKCLFTMHTKRDASIRDANGVIVTKAWCSNEACEQYNKVVIIPPLSLEAEEV